MLPKEAVFSPARGNDVVITLCCGKRNKLAGDGGNPGNRGYLCDHALGDCPTKGFGDPAASGRQIGAVLVKALLHVLVHAARQTIERDEAAKRRGQRQAP